MHTNIKTYPDKGICEGHHPSSILKENIFAIKIHELTPQYLSVMDVHCAEDFLSVGRGGGFKFEKCSGTLPLYLRH